VVEEEEEDDEGLVVCSARCCPRINSTPPVKPEEPTHGQMCLYVFKWLLYVLAFPYYFMMTFTIPDCSKEHTK